MNELQQKNKTLERENKILNEKLELQSKSKFSDTTTLEKKLEKAIEDNTKLWEELD